MHPHYGTQLSSSKMKMSAPKSRMFSSPTFPSSGDVRVFHNTLRRDLGCRIAFSLLFLLVAAIGCGSQQSSGPKKNSGGDKGTAKAPANSSVKESDGKLIEDIWEASFIGAAKVGHTHTQVRELTLDGKSVRRRTSEQVLRLSRAGDIAEQRLNLDSLETADGEVISMSSEMTSQDVAMRTEAKVQDGVLQLSLSTGGQPPKTMQLPWPEGTSGYFGLYQSLTASPMKPGESRELKSFMPAVNQIATMTLKARERAEKITVIDGKVNALPIDASLKLGPTQHRQILWMDEAGQVISSFDPQVRLHTYQTTREQALAKSDGVFEFDDTVFIKATGKALDSPHEKKRAVYVVTVQDEDPTRLFPATDMQKVRSVGPNRAELVIVKPEGLAPTLADAAADDDRVTNALIQSDDPRVRAMANSVATNESEPIAIAMALERLVHEKVERKDYTRAFDSAADVARKLQGDCTEHSVLLAALCRARGVPARVVSGLVAFGDGFAYHMWTEAWTGAAWMPLDATLGKGGIGVGHIKLVHSNLAGANSFAALLPVLQVIGRLQIHVEDVQ